MTKGALPRVGHTPLMDREILLTEWDYTTEHLPPDLRARVAEVRQDGSWVIALSQPVNLSGGFHGRLVISARHVGYPLTRILPGPLHRLAAFLRVRLPALVPVVAVNVSTKSGGFFAVASVKLR